MVVMPLIGCSQKIENPMLHAHFASVCDIDAELLAMEFSHHEYLDFY